MKEYQYCHIEAITYPTQQFKEDYITVLSEPYPNNL